MPLLGLRAEQDDDPRLDADRRDPPGRPATPAGSSVEPDLGARRAADPRRGHRQLGRHRSPPTGSRARAAGWSAARPGSTGRAGWSSATTPSSPPAGSWSPPARPPSYRRSRGWPTPATGPTARRSRPTSAPESLVVLGGGAVGVELAQMFARYGSTVTVVEATDRLLPPEEPEAGEVVATALRADGVDAARWAPRRSTSPGSAATSVTVEPRGRYVGPRRRAARQRGPPRPGRRDRRRLGRARPAGAGDRGRRADARGRPALGGRRRDRRRARSRTWRCTRRASRSTTSSAGTARPPTTPGWRG